MEKIAELLSGGFDFHIHAAPDGFRQRSLDFQDAARQAKQKGMGGIAIKNHDFCTAPLTQLVTGPDVSVFGGVVLNHAVGGLNPDAVSACARLGGKFVWMPTFSAASDKSEAKVKKEVRLLSSDGMPVSFLEGLLETVRDSEMILATGHLGFREILLLVEISKRIGLRKIVVNHPFRLESPNLKIEEQLQLAAAGAVLEHCSFHFLKPGAPLRSKTAQRRFGRSESVPVPSPPTSARWGIRFLPRA